MAYCLYRRSSKLSVPIRSPEPWQDRLDCVYFPGDGVTCQAARVIDRHPDGWPSDHAAVLATLALPAPAGAP